MVCAFSLLSQPSFVLDIHSVREVIADLGQTKCGQERVPC